MLTNRLAAVTMILVMGLTLINPFQSTQAADHTYTVTTADDGVVNSLRWAINQANTHAGSGELDQNRFCACRHGSLL